MEINYPAFGRASVMIDVFKVELQNRRIPELHPGEVLVEIEAVGVCGSDTHFYEEGVIGDIIVEGPIVLGHESAGQIAAVGPGVDPERVGTRVAIEPQKPCRRCEFCKSGRYHLCPKMEFYGAYPIDGSFADYAVIDDDFAHAMPDEMSGEEGALIEPVSVALHACRRAKVLPASKVLIAGAGPIGALTAQVARAFGAIEIVVSDPIENRRRFALEHGATGALDPAVTDLSEYGEYFDVFIDASGNPNAILSAIPAIKRGGQACLVGMGGQTLEVPIALLQHREISLTGTYRYANTWPDAIALVASGKLRVKELVTHRYGLDQVGEALMKTKTDPLAIKTIVIPAMTL
ncbi:NAD(P)-dependent alcohol dehydrogenase [Nesterenkonia natronophila]|uniref:NAD(P)-dependent alcohol dehydrogenase n=1 Tax=Nesterenkonia natronophila TaxID=2174932 RepID=A0A3A4F3H1_9MICC|nr:NAD(P)-dependent alcohol dehydrogenase [Nesterenkonia natronophila]RJN32613.1 NAD(P)-dependent alcohol dehydrogenase [Nesterenkonia natronophila]